MDKSDHALRQSGERQNSERQIGDNWIASDNLAVVGKAESAGNLLRREAYCHMKPTIKGSDEALKPTRQPQTTSEPASITFSPLAPSGAHISYDGRDRMESVGGAVRFTTTEEQQSDRDKPFAHSQDGHLNDGYFGVLSDYALSLTGADHAI